MKVSFAAQYPTFGTKHNRSPVSYQQRSPYYWWWAYLRRNKRYIECCANNGEGELADLYTDFGDVREDFYTWWTTDKRGAVLFSENYTTSVKVLKDKAEWNESWTSSDMVVIAFPLTSNKRYLQAQLHKILNLVHTVKRGRKADRWSKSTATYRLNRNFTIESLRIALDVYDEYVINETRSKAEKLTLWEMGVKLKLVKTAMPSKTDAREDNIIKRNRMAVAVNRYIQQAKRVVEGVEEGVFPK